MALVPEELADARLLGVTRWGARRVLVFDRTSGPEGARRYQLHLVGIDGRALTILRTQTLDAHEFPSDARWEGVLAPSLRDEQPPASCGSEWAPPEVFAEVSASVSAWATTFTRPGLISLGGESHIMAGGDPDCGYADVPYLTAWYVDGGLHGLGVYVDHTGCGAGVVRLTLRDQVDNGATAVCGGAAWVRIGDPALHDGAFTMRRFDLTAGEGAPETRWRAPASGVGRTLQVAPMQCDDGHVVSLAYVREANLDLIEHGHVTAERSRVRAVAVVTWR